MGTENGNENEPWGDGARYFTVDEVNAHVPKLMSLFGTIMGLRAQLKTIFQRLEAVGHAPEESAPSLGAPHAMSLASDDTEDDEDDDEDGEDTSADDDEDDDDAHDDEDGEDSDAGDRGALPPDVARDRLVFHGMAETLRDHVEAVLATGCVIKDIEIGLVDWLGKHEGRDIWLCWRYGEREVGFWHEHAAGFASRRPVSELRAAPSHAR
jgi:hypothetical protein